MLTCVKVCQESKLQQLFFLTESWPRFYKGFHDGGFTGITNETWKTSLCGPVVLFWGVLVLCSIMICLIEENQGECYSFSRPKACNDGSAEAADWTSLLNGDPVHTLTVLYIVVSLK